MMDRSVGRFRGAVVALALGAATPGAALALPAAGPGAGGGAAGRAADCAFCAVQARHAQALERATREVGALPHGAVIHYRSDDPETVVELQKLAFERQQLCVAARADARAVPMCAGCGARFDRMRDASFEVANSVHGVFIVITSADPEVVRKLHALASEET